jgi:multiple sugar transport system ATP-binding protein
MSEVVLKHIQKTYPNGYQAVKDFNLSIADKEFIIFVGPSGCGKSTTLRMVAGLEDITGGELTIDGKVVNDKEPKDRDIAMVFQNYALYPHMTVKQNLEYPLKIAKLPKDEIEKRVMEAANTLGLVPLLDRKPAAMSGGQRQRVAMGRAIVRNPKVLLMDEPLSNLDAKLRGQMRVEISKLHKKLGSTIIYVTHDQTEAMTLGDRIVVMSDGDVQQIDTPKVLYDNPANKFVAGFIGAPQMNFIDCKLALKNGKNVLEFGNNTIALNEENVKLIENAGYNLGDTICAGIRPENIFVANSDSADNISGTVDVYEMLGSTSNLYITVNGQQLVATMGPEVHANVGDAINIGFDASKLHLFDNESGKNLKFM